MPWRGEELGEEEAVTAQSREETEKNKLGQNFWVEKYAAVASMRGMCM
jgi:hypothetical protein